MYKKQSQTGKLNINTSRLNISTNSKNKKRRTFESVKLNQRNYENHES